MARWNRFFTLTAVALFIPCVAMAESAPRVFFGNLKGGETVSSPLTVEMGVEGYAIEPAGAAKEGTGHHHLVIDGGPVPAGEVVPADETHLHFGKGQTSASVTLPPGEHTLTLQFADGLHRSYGEKLSQSVHVTVK